MTAAEYKEWITPQRSPEDYLSGAPRYYAISIAEYKANPFYRENWDTGLVYPTIWATDFAEFEKYQLERFPELVKAKERLSQNNSLAGIFALNPLRLFFSKENQKQADNLFVIAMIAAAIYWFYKKKMK